MFSYRSSENMNRLHNSPNSPGSFLGGSKNTAVWIFADYSSYNSKLWPALCGGLVKNTEFNWLYWGLCWRCGGLAKSLECSPQGENRKRCRTQNFNAAPLNGCHQIKIKLHPNQFIYWWLLSWFRHTSLTFLDLCFAWFKLLFLIKISKFCPMLNSHDTEHQSLSQLHHWLTAHCTGFLFSLQHSTSLFRQTVTHFVHFSRILLGNSNAEKNRFRSVLFFCQNGIFFMQSLYFSAFDKHLCKKYAIFFCRLTVPKR